MTRAQPPIRRRLMTMLLLSSGAVALVMFVGTSIYEYVTYRQSTLRHLTTIGNVIAANSGAALAFDNADDATEVLGALQAEPGILAAGLYGADGRLFATYPADPAGTELPATTGKTGFRFQNGELVGFQSVLHGNRKLGMLYLRADMTAMYERMGLYAAIVALIIALSALVAYLISRRLQHQISRPILALAATAKDISDRRDYSVRAVPASGHELSQLTAAFNHMLATTEGAQSRLQTQLSRLDLLHRITRAISERQDLPSIFTVVLRTLEDNLPIDFSCACMYDAAAPRLTVCKVGGKSTNVAAALGLVELAQVPIDANGLSRCVAGALVYEPNTRAIPFPFPQRLASVGLLSMVAAPMLVENRVFGVLLCARQTDEGFTSADCEFLRQLTEHVALASHQAQLHSALQQAYDDLRQTQHAVMQQERLRALGQMASGIAHDINNAIAPVALYTESLLEREPNLSERTRSYLTTIQRAIEDVAETVSRMREFYRTREPQMQLSRVSLNRMVEQVLHLTRARWTSLPQQRGVVVQVKTELADDLPEIMGAEGEIRDALTNLIFNALDAMPEGGTLTLRTQLQATQEAAGDTTWHAQLQVCDTGIGMDEETRRRCLEPFYTTKGERGTGLGLAMVYGMVQRHSAELVLASEPGKGTTFTLRFAAAEAVVDAAVVRLPAPPAASKPLRLLIVDDDPLLIASLRDILEGDGHAVTAADGGQAGIEAVRTALAQGATFDAVITDLGMPYVDGRKVAAAIKAMRPSLPVIMLTGWGKRLIAENEIPSHVDRVLSKPPRLADLRLALYELTEPSQGVISA